MDHPFLETYDKTKAWLDGMGIGHYTTHDDLTVDVRDRVDISCKNLSHIPVRFGCVDGTFDCKKNQLTSLVGSPVTCWVFDCSHNHLTSLDGTPTRCDHYYCEGNQITSLVSSPAEPWAVANPQAVVEQYLIIHPNIEPVTGE